MISSLLIKAKLDYLDFKRLHVQQNHLASILEAWHRNDSAALAIWAFDDGRLRTRLVAYNVDVGSLFEDETILVLERIAPYGC